MFILPAILDQNQFDSNILKYCPFDLVSNDLYDLIYNIYPQVDNANYCPFDLVSNDLYEIL